MPAWLAVLALVLAALAMHWGSRRLAHPLRKLRDGWGFSPAAGGTLVGIAAASPEILINCAGAARGVTNIGLGAMLGSNIYAMPLIVTVTYLAARTLTRANGSEPAPTPGSPAHASATDADSPEPGAPPPSPGRVPVVAETLSLQVLPYLAIIALVAVLTIPPRWRGVQPMDGWILAGAYLAYFVQAIARKRRARRPQPWRRREVLLAFGGVLAMGAGAFAAIRATESLAGALGLSQGAAGLFLTAPVAALPELFAAWKVGRAGQVTAAVTSVVGDNAVTLTLAFVPLAIVGTEIEDFGLYCVNLGVIAAVAGMYAVFMKADGKEPGFGRLSVIALDSVLAAYLVGAIGWVVLRS
ncbi:MAG TPA: hypothetical protein VFF69_08330 [Phycisphaerales bacterium]|nr:hypothetical protein [Phycisphaerales bacterium]